VSDEGAEAYLRQVAEAALRRAGGQLRELDTRAAADPGFDPGMDPFTAASAAQWKVLKAGRILVAAGALDPECLDRVAADLSTAIAVRSRILLSRDRRRGVLSSTLFAPPSRPPLSSHPASRALSVTPIGRTLRAASDRAPSALHFLALVQTGTEAVLAVAMRMHWPPDGSSVDLEITGAGPHHLPYGQLLVVDDQGTRYSLQFEGDARQTGTWSGVARLSPVPPPGARWLGLTGDGTRLIELPLTGAAGHGHPTMPAVAEPTMTPPAERLLMLEAERILTSGNVAGPAEGPHPDEIITVLTESGVIPDDSPVPGQLAALGQRLGAGRPSCTDPPAAELPVPWSSVLAHRDVPAPANGPEVFAPLAIVLPNVDGVRFVLTGLSAAAGESHLHVVSSGMPEPTDRFAHDWTPDFSWWLRDGAGNWHVGAPAAPWSFGDGLQAFWLRWMPPLVMVPGPAELVVTGPATRVRVTLPIGDDAACA
jgi:hypothetical protein